MTCKECKAYGIDDIGFHGCLIRNSMRDFKSGKVGCYKRESTILNAIKEVKQNEPRAKYYMWKE